MNKALEVYLSGNTKELDAALSRADKSLKEFGSKMESIGKTMSVAFTAPLVAIGAASIKMASDFNESMNKVDVAFKGSSKTVKDFAKTSLDSFGIAEGTALDMAALFGDMSTSMGLSTKEAAKLSTSLVGLAGDLSSFKNMNIGEVTTALNGIFTGETESLKRLGVVMTEANLKTFALSKGFKTQYDQMSQGEKVMLRYNYIMDVTKNAQGDFERTQGGAANQMRKFQQGMEQLGASFGQVLLPIFTSIVTKLNDVIKGFQGLDKGTKTTIAIIGGLTALAGPMLYLAGTVIPKVIVGIGYLKTAITALANNIRTAGLIGLFAALTGYVVQQQMAYSSATSATNDLSDADKKSVVAIKAKNKELYNSIVLLEQSKKEAQKFDATQKALNQNSKSNTAAVIQAEIDKKRALIVSNRELIKSAQNLENAENKEGEAKKGNIALTPEQIAANEKVATSMINLRNKSVELKNELDQIWKDIQEFNKSQIINAPQVGSTKELDQFQKRNIDILKKQYQVADGGGEVQIKSPFELMAERIAPAVEQINTYSAIGMGYIDGWNQKVVEMQSQAESAFSAIGQAIVSGLGGTNTFLGSLLSTIAQIMVKMGAMYLAESIFTKKKIAENKAEATSEGIKIGAKAAASIGGWGALIALAPFIALAVGTIGSAFNSVPAFAAGGIVSGPTMALTGEYPGAKSNPEVIAPLDKLQSMLDTGGNNVNVTGEFIVRGQDLVLALNRAEKQYNRLT